MSRAATPTTTSPEEAAGATAAHSDPAHSDPVHSKKGAGSAETTAEKAARAVTMGEHVYPLRILERHLDTFGHVNNATYLELFEQARWDLIAERGYGLERIEETRLGPVILEATVKFRREVKNREQVTIHTRLESYEGKIASLRQQMRKEDGTLACEARFLMGLWDLDARKLIPPTDEWLRAVTVEVPNENQ